jgi:CheY-like chemotaxis protein/HPt (histidine-containing phosphotransfer) domain-containing protein
MSAPGPNGGAATGARILLAEDNPVNQKVAVAILRRLGHAVEVVPNGGEAVTAIGRSRFDLVFMDCQMPHMDGYEATARIRQLEAGAARVPIIAMTANAMSGDREQCLAAGMDDYLSKPIDPDTLAAMLERWLTGTSPNAGGASDATTTRAPGETTAAVAIREASVEPVVIARLQGVVGSEPETIRSYLQLFVRIVDGLVAQLADATSAADAKTVRRFAHQIKGSAASIGADELASIAGALEKLAAAGQVEGADEHFARLRPAYGRVVAFIEAY